MTKAGRILGLILLLATVGCDRVTKHYAITNLAGSSGQSYLADTIRLEYAENKGAFLSLGTNLPDWARTGLFIFGVGTLLTAVAFVALRQRWTGCLFIGAVFLWAGGLSNLIDRVAHGSVVDFMNIGLGSLRTGIFNVADVAILTGEALIVIGSWRYKAVSSR